MSEDTNIIHGNVVIGQSGGPTHVINASLVGILEGLRGHDNIGKIYGANHGVRGIIEENFIELQDIPQNRLDRLAKTPSAALGSSRDKPDEAYCRKVLEVFEKNNIRYFFYIGGNDSSDTCRIVNDLAKADGYELRAFHVPKTIDNDLVHNDHTPGFGSAAKFVAMAFMGDDLDNRALPGIKINIVMGRHAGFLTAASVLARNHTDDGPHLIYVPEVAFNIEKFKSDVEETYNRLGRCIVAVSEGIHDANGTPMLATVQSESDMEKDAHGNVQLSGTGALGDFLVKAVKDKMGAVRVRADTFGYLQRSFAGCSSKIDLREAREAGVVAAKFALSGDVDGSICMVRISDEPYTIEFRRIELSDVAAKTRTIDLKFIINNNNIEDSFKTYLKPLVGDLPEIELLRASH